MSDSSCTESAPVQLLSHSEILAFIDELAEFMQRPTGPEKVEVWLSAFVPMHDEDGQEVVFRFKPPFWYEQRPPPDAIYLMNRTLYEQRGSELLGSGIPVYDGPRRLDA